MYKLYKTTFGKNAVMKQNEDGSLTSFMLGTGSAEEQAYLKWLDEGNEPLPADSATPLPAENT
jgi:hypothetical protein